MNDRIRRLHLCVASLQLLLLGFTASALGQSQVADSAEAAATDYYDIGGLHREVTTDSDEAQLWFDRGMAMCYAFNHEEALRCFDKAYTADPTMPMALWGWAYASGPNINNIPIEPHIIAQAKLATRLAKQLVARLDAQPWEIEVIDALGARYATPVPEDRAPLNLAYVSAMRNVYEKHPDNQTVAALFAESLMVMRPWKLWANDGTPAPETDEIVAVLESSLKKWPNDPALCHYYIHTMEASPNPERALPAANRLRTAMLGSGHLVHMPSHIDIRLGNYQSAINANQLAIEVDEAFKARQGVENFYSFYRIHNYHFLTYAAMFAGQKNLALTTARKIPQQVPEPMIREMGDFLDAFMAMPMHVMVRFGMWNEILAEPQPAEYLPASRSIWHYARGIAFAATNRVAQAKLEQQALASEIARVPETSILFNNSSLDILQIAKTMLDGEVSYREGKHALGFAQLREATLLGDALNYDEPWGWMQPPRHALGALLLEQGLVKEAGIVYQNDLKQFPKNVWALHGLAESLRRQRRITEADEIQQQLVKARAGSDVTIDRSCYCRTQAQP